jgi:hypothetical protein
MKIEEDSWGNFPQTPYFLRSYAKNLVSRVYSWGLCNAKSICICEILRVAQNDKGKRALI